MTVHRRDPPPQRSALGAQRSEGGGRNLWTHRGNPGAGPASGFDVGAVEPVEIDRQARRRSITGKFCFGAVPYTVQRHDCRGIIAAAAARVHSIDRRLMRAADAAMPMCRKRGFTCARTRVAGTRCSSVATATGAISTAPIVRRGRVADRCTERAGATRRAVAAGSNMRSGRAAIGPGKTGHTKIK